MEMSHMRDAIERRRTRTLRVLLAQVDLLSEGLLAIKRNPPKVHVMIDHAERALDALRAEIEQLKEDAHA